MDYQKMYEEVKADRDMVRLRNDELSKMAVVIDSWELQPKMQASRPINRMKNFCEKYQKIYIYGAGKKAERAVQALEGVEYQGFVVSNKQEGDTIKFNHPIYEWEEVSDKLQKENTVLLVALNPQNTKEILPMLAAVNLNAVYFME